MTDTHKIHYTKEIFVKDYFDIHNHYVKLFGKSTLILMQVGSFHECYNTDNDGPDLFYLGERINMTVTQKNKSKELSTSNPRMMGFPSYIVEDMVERIVSLGYTIIRIDQTSEPPNPKREVVGIFSPSTILNNNNYNKYLISIVFDALKLKTTNPILCIGLTAYDMTSGIGCVYETVSTNYDSMIALDNATRFLEKYPPSEIIYHFSNQLDSFIKNNGSINRMSHDDILKYLRIDINSMTTYNIPNINMVTNVKYQSELIESIFKNNLDNINLHAYNYARTSLVGLLEFTKNHQPILLKKLSEPIYFDNENTLYLGNKALDQLDVISEGSNKPKTLFDIINYCNTPMGKRYLIDQLCNPLINVEEINNRYNNIELLLEDKMFEKINSEMRNIYDLPKIIRKMELNKVYPSEIVHLINSIEQIMNVFNIVKKIKLLGINKELIEKLKEIYDHINKTFDMKYIENLSFANYKEESTNFIINNNYDILCELMFNINICTNFMDNLVYTLEKFIEEQNSKVIKKDVSSITLKNNDRDGHYMLLTKRRCKILQEKLSKMEHFNVGSIEIKVSDLEFKDLPTGNNTKITCKDIVKYSNEVSNLKAKLAIKIKEAFYNEINIIIDSYKDTIINVSNIIKNLDFLNSGANSAYNLGYCRPTIDISNNVSNDSYFKATELRHPIVEVINTDTEYHPHNISLGNNNKGILLYGINSSGKSTLMKSIGLAIIMAQIGYYVPAKYFIYAPYKNLFTRIVGSDNLFRGMSSFMSEMIELMAILKRNNNNTLVIADEICHSTEEKSANIIVSYMLETLEKSNSSFITATHLHSVADLPSVKNIQGIKTMHISVSYDEVKDMLIYSRELKEGQGDKYYGVMVAKYMMRNDEFNIRTKELEYEYDNYHIKKSNYNKDVFMFECHICKSKNNLESHHINFQKDCDNVKVINKPHIKKNAKYNLVILCSKCHDKIDRNEIIVKGWIKTSDGIMLDYC